ncbi:MAG TPA: type II toxin-antitoxin system PemK/MazF family toxin [Firmicutes bacterium]|nr:type II toxin-antitoxin system PemK/MazF family toxin [Bacillota bacterium]HHY98537.1 type II toxin-antitoxin system PemK/MazF family toxin [Bacillota bacterium]
MVVMPEPSRGDIWLVDLDPARGHEQAGKRPGLVVSVDPFNYGPAELVVVLPITTRKKDIPFHVEVNPPEGGLKEKSFVKCEDIRSMAKERLTARLGAVSPSTMAAVEYRLRILLGLR